MMFPPAFGFVPETKAAVLVQIQALFATMRRRGGTHVKSFTDTH